MVFLGSMGGVVGGIYTASVLRFNALRAMWLTRRWKKVAEAVLLSVLSFAILFHVPYAFGCDPCPLNSNCGGSSGSSAVGNATLSSGATCLI